MGNRASLVDGVAGKTPGPLEIERLQMKRCRGELEELHPGASRSVRPSARRQRRLRTISPHRPSRSRACALLYWQKRYSYASPTSSAVRAFLRCRERAPIRAGQALKVGRSRQQQAQ